MGAPYRRVSAVLRSSVALAALVLWAAAPAWAGPDGSGKSAPEYASSEPSQGEKVHEAPDEVSVTFSEPLDPSSTLTVTDECGRDVDDDNVQVFVTEMSVGISEKPSGRYTVTYEAQGVGGVTGTTEDSFSFEVHMGPGCDGSESGHHHDDGDHQDKHDGNHGGHDDHDMDDHDMDEHSDSTGEHGDHVLAAGPHHDGHGEAGHGDGGHGGRGHEGHHDNPGGGKGNSDTGDPPALAAGPSAGIESPAGEGALIVGLGFAIGLGMVGGWLLRENRV